MIIYPMSNLQGLKTHSLVARETTGKDFLMPRHFSRSMNNEFDLIFRSCSSLALFCSSTWNDNNEWNIVVFSFCAPGEPSLPPKMSPCSKMLKDRHNHHRLIIQCLPGVPSLPHSASCWANQCSLEAGQPRNGSCFNTEIIVRANINWPLPQVGGGEGLGKVQHQADVSELPAVFVIPGC